MATVADIMDTDPVTVTPETSVEEVVTLMKTHELPGVPVVNEGGRCIGIITEQDLVLRDDSGDDLHLPHYIELFGGLIYWPPELHRYEERLRKAAASTAQDLMTEDPVTIDADADVAEAGRVIAEKHHNRLPVVQHGRLVGVVTRVDVLGSLATAG